MPMIVKVEPHEWAAYKTTLAMIMAINGPLSIDRE